MMQSSLDLDPSEIICEDEKQTLSDKLTLSADEMENFEPIPAQLLRKVR